MDSPVQPVPLLIPSSIREALASIFIGVIIATCTYGMSILQAYNYFRRSSQDSPHMKCFVALLFVVDTVSLVLAVCTGYHFVVTDFGDPLSLLQVPTPMAFENGTSLLRTSSMGVEQTEHSARRQHCPGMGAGYSVQTKPGFSSASATAPAYCATLQLRTGFRRTESMIDHLIIYAVNRGVLTTLNAQKSMREDGTNVVELDTQVLDRIKTSRIGRSDPEHKGPQGVGHLKDEAAKRTSTFVLDISGDNKTDLPMADA
ncbi:hypothetical protein V8D89_005101 [Ganoderma adspersum]